MNLNTNKNFFLELNRIQRWGIFILLFILAELISQHFKVKDVTETTIRISVGFAFFIYVISPRRNWVFIFIIQLLLTYVLSFRNYQHSIIIVTSESLTSLISAASYIYLTKKVSNLVYLHTNLLLPLSAAVGSLTTGLLLFFVSEYFIPGWLYPDFWITWTMSCMIGILLFPNIKFKWQTLNIKTIFSSQKKQWFELTILLLTTLVVTNLIFSTKLTELNLSINFPYLLLPLIVWAAVRFNPFILSLLLFFETISILQYIKPFYTPYMEAGLSFYFIIYSTQLFILFTLEFSYVIAQIIITRNKALENINKLNESLEVSVTLRTTELKQALEALGESEQQFREAFETAMHGMAMVRLDGSFIRVNQSLCDMLGYDKSALLGSDFQKISYHNDYNLEKKKFKKLASGSIFFYQMEKRLIHRDKLALWVLAGNSLITSSDGTPLRIVSQIIDITERKQSENQLKKYSETLTILLREVNHRVKNNLSALIGILHLEEEKVETGGKSDYVSLVKDLTSRIQGLATVHSMLSAANWSPLELKQLCEQIIHSVISGLPANKSIGVRISPSRIRINSNQSHHLAIVLNELATNSVKYGIPGGKDGVIDILISQLNGTIHLQYKDNGPGYPEHLLSGNFTRATIGMELIRGIITQSLDGEFKIHNGDGAIIDIWFLNELA